MYPNGFKFQLYLRTYCLRLFSVLVGKYNIVYCLSWILEIGFSVPSSPLMLIACAHVELVGRLKKMVAYSASGTGPDPARTSDSKGWHMIQVWLL